MKRWVVIIVLGLGVVGTVAFFGLGGWSYVRPRIHKQTTQDVLANVGPNARAFWKSNVPSYPPQSVTFLAIKDTAQLEVWADSPKKKIAEFPILKASGNAGPKLREGDRQVPEGVYDITALNPNSSYHLSMRVDYPNKDDLKWAKIEGRDQPGSDIFIHGERVSIGCLAMGNDTIEKLYVLVGDVGVDKTRVIIAPSDPRIAPLKPPDSPGWVKGRYKEISEAFAIYRD